jgi:hypothetical protein
MIPPTDSPCVIRFASNANRRQFAERARATAALMMVHSLVILVPVDEHGAPLPEAIASVQQEQINQAIAELSHGRLHHARQTIARLESSSYSISEQVDRLLDTLYAAKTQGGPSTAVLDAFLDTFETWLAPEGIAKVDELFLRVDLNRAPDALGILLLATTRLTRNHFVERDAFLERLAKWLVGRNGRTPEDVNKMLLGLRE